MKKGKNFVLTSMVIFFLFVSLLLCTQNTQAKVVLSTMNEQYNLGDEINQNIKVITSDDFKGFLRATLVCTSQDSTSESGFSGQETLLFYSPISLDQNKEKQFSFSFTVSNPSKCYISATLEKNSNVAEEGKSTTFLITDKVNLELTTAKQYFLPEDELKVTGKATMANGKSFSGAVTITLENKDYTTTATGESFSYTITLEKTIAPGMHVLLVKVIDDKGNTGEASTNYEIGVVKTALAILVNNMTFLPGDILVITPFLLDQANNSIEENLSVSIIQISDILLGFQQKRILLNEIVLSGKSTQYKFAKDAIPQDYKITVTGAGFTTETIVRISTVEKIIYHVEESTLFVKNIGNVRYQNPLEIYFTIENITNKKIINLDLAINEEKSYQLSAPKGIYDLLFKSNDAVEEINKVPISGSVIGTVDLENKEQQATFTPIIILIVLVFLVSIVILLKMGMFGNIFKKKKKKRLPEKIFGYEVYHDELQSSSSTMNKPTSTMITKTPGSSNKIISKPSSSVSSFISFSDSGSARSSSQQQTPQKQVKMSDIRKYESSKKIERAVSTDTMLFSSSSDVMRNVFDKYAQGLEANRITPKTIMGQKKEISILMVRVSGMSELMDLKKRDTYLFDELSNSYFSKVIQKISQGRGIADFADGHFIIFFNAVDQPNHYSSALRVAQEIKKSTEEFNQEIAAKGQSFRMGVAASLHAGPLMVASIGMDRTLKYAPLADTTAIAKSLERKAFKGEILMSESFYNKVSGSVQVKKITPLSLGKTAMNVYMIQETIQEKKKQPSWMK
ncbi:MAG: hypothetical protein NTX24_05155 [Candidatus Pacearchaeota archaeon]|nr:hypothetical protein [Candidatus Pacearchaeota archaeon]